VVTNLLLIRVPPIVPVSARALADFPLMRIVNSRALMGWVLSGMPTVVLNDRTEPSSFSSSLLTDSASDSSSSVSSEARTWLVFTSFFGHSFAMCPLSPQ